MVESTNRPKRPGDPSALPRRKKLDGSEALNQKLLSGLNPQQAEAVQHQNGPLLILAGAGSGKTRVITHRVAWLICVHHVDPYAILAITFTNKAANEMKKRIANLVGPVSRFMWIGTFHAMMVRILRQYGDRIGYDRNFAILDMDDQYKVIKKCLKDLNLDEKRFAIKAVHGQISAAKNALNDVDMFKQQTGHDFYRGRVAQVYACYQAILKKNNSMDFDDILFETVRLFEQYPDILKEYQEKFQYILVDEYQDTNHAQYKLVHLLSKKHHNICVVGDDDQSIYGFRGANIRNILDFEKDFKRCCVIKLEQNYRSTGHVLKAANAVIDHNEGRKKKALWTKQGDGELITFFRGDTQAEEGHYIAAEINRQVVAFGQPYQNFAILYRLNALSRSVEQALREQGIPYKIYGGQRFYDRKEIKDILAYLRLIVMPDDDLSLERVINVPRRGIGQVTTSTLASIAAREGLSQMAVCAQAERFPELQRTAHRLKAFYMLIERMRKQLETESLTLDQYLDWIEQETGLIQELLDQQEKTGLDNSIDRIENLKELISDAVEFENQMRSDSLLAQGDEQSEGPGEPLDEHDDLADMIRGFLERTALYTDMDQEHDEDDHVRLLTIHSAKGLEFNTVFLVGAEEGLFPGFRSMGSQEDYEEERRLAYVAMTRAQKKLHITTARTRLLFGQTQRYPISTFIKEIPDQHVDSIGGSHTGRDNDFGYDRASAAAAPQTTIKGRRRIQFPGAPEFKTEKDSSGRAKIHKREGSIDFSRGDRVRHPRFGQGRVVSADPVADDMILVIEFVDHGKKRFMARMADVTKIEA